MNFSYDDIFSISNEEEFNELAIKIFYYQYQKNTVYHQFVNHLFRNKSEKLQSILHYTQIPFLPVELFKTQVITCFPVKSDTLYFESSGTTQQNLSRHYIFDEQLYRTSIFRCFEKFYGHPEDYLFVFLLPDENERPHSSLVYMAKYLKSFSKYKESGFYMNDLCAAKRIIVSNLNSGIKIFLMGLSYALLDLCELSLNLNENVIVMETGGMKGRRDEMPKKIFHEHLKKKLAIPNIHSEYGMTELLSQAYSQKDGKFVSPPWMKILVRELDDPFTIYTKNRQGLINIIDLANIHSCSFIATSDIGKLNEFGDFELLGRSDFSDIRGCNLMYQ